MRLAENDILDIVHQVWGTMLGMDLGHAPGSASPVEPTLTGVVQITGAWQGAVTLKCSRELASRITGAMFGLEVTSEEETRDALGEVVNMLAGNFKAHLPGGCHLSLPAVVEGRDYRVAVPGASLIRQLCLTSETDPFLVAILERSEAATPSTEAAAG